jgi:hypothetical protein
MVAALLTMLLPIEVSLRIMVDLRAPDEVSSYRLQERWLYE